jgi:Concanavalin A-like lectin/glucanases superfamily
VGQGVVGPNALSVNGGQQFAASAGPVIDTSSSFTISAWVDLNNTNGYQTFASQDGNEVSGFYLQLRGDTGRFAFTRIVADAPAQAAIASAPSIIPQPGEWYHLAGVYNAAKRTISLYVNGKLQQTQPFTQPWHPAARWR